ncbi:methionyl-tRNA formyltransferase [Pseudotenacibaculum haliotis]|uniref:Methionyl-tRNA formyltransferase n=1 Tax=Pseudotenacibaculum haliotis TaxID=1862138 RepID=A0ABW5LX60_9FLAO
MRDLKIVFMGTPDFAVAILDRIVKDGYNVVGVITAPDKPAGRGRKLQASAVKKYAESQGLHLLQPTNLKDEGFLNDLKSLEANLQVVVAFRMLPKVVWNMPEYGTFNLHASLLPDYRGAAPIHWSIINGEEKTGVTTFFIDEKIDTGEMILKKEVSIDADETVGQLHDRLMHLGAQAVSETLDLIKEDQVTTSKQPESDTKLAPKLNPENCKVNWEASLDTIYNHIRGLNPFPAAWSEMQNGEETVSMKLYAVQKEKVAHSLEIKSIVTTKKEIKVAVAGGYIILDELKLSGKKKMDAKSLLNGFSFHSDAKML